MTKWKGIMFVSTCDCHILFLYGHWCSLLSLLCTILWLSSLAVRGKLGSETRLINSDTYPSMSRSTIQRWLKLSSAYAESPLRVGCLEWPLRISPSHALQLQAAAAIRALSPVKSRHSQVSKQSLSKSKVGLFPSLSPPVLLRQSNATVISTELLSWCMHSIMKCYVYIVQINGDSCSMLCTCIVKLL